MVFLCVLCVLSLCPLCEPLPFSLRHYFFTSLHPSSSHIQQRLIQIRNDILHILNPHAQSHQTIRNPHSFPHLFRHRSVRHLCRQRNQRLHSAQTFRQRANLHLV